MALQLVVKLLADATGLTRGVGQAEGSIEGLGKKAGPSGLGGILSGGIGKFAAFAGVAALAISSVTNAAAEDAAEQARLEAAIKASGAATGDWENAMNSAISTAQEKAFTDTQAREALISLTTATGDVTAAQALMSS